MGRMYRERRKCARLAMKANVGIQIGYLVGEGELGNLSVKGAFVAPAPHIVRQLALHEMVIFTVLHTSIRTRARVVRLTDQGMGLEFGGTLLD